MTDDTFSVDSDGLRSVYDQMDSVASTLAGLARTVGTQYRGAVESNAFGGPDDQLGNELRTNAIPALENFVTTLEDAADFFKLKGEGVKGIAAKAVEIADDANRAANGHSNSGYPGGHGNGKR
jgi:hypothetical protein